MRTKRNIIIICFLTLHIRLSCKSIVVFIGRMYSFTFVLSNILCTFEKAHTFTTVESVLLDLIFPLFLGVTFINALCYRSLSDIPSTILSKWSLWIDYYRTSIESYWIKNHPENFNVFIHKALFLLTKRYKLKYLLV